MPKVKIGCYVFVFAMSAGFPRESLKFARKSLSLYPSDEAKALIEEVCRRNPELGEL